MKSFLLVSMVLFGTWNVFATQQEVNYTIDVRLDDKKHVLHAYEEIEYVNHSTTTLNEIYFHLWPNAYKNNETALAKQLVENGSAQFYFAEEKDRGYIDSLDFKVDQKPVKWILDEQYIDICKLILNKPLEPGQKITISTPFRVKIPKGIYSRLGHIEESYQITQWYPKPAVFDQKGWHPMPYLTLGEFYSEYGSFNVRITLPKNYVVGATGDLQTATEQKWLDELAKKGAQTTFTKPKKNSPDIFPVSDSTFKTLVYTQSNVHDFAWFADKRFHVLKGEVELSHSKRKVTTWSMFTNHEAHLWKNSIEYLNDAIYNYSLWNGDYPYQQMTAVDGALSAGGGMEYPNVTVVGKSGSELTLEIVIMHETGHQWFYGILGSNERDHAWMDEGINTSNEIRYLEKKYPKANLLGMKQENGIARFFDLDRPMIDRYYMGYNLCARNHSDQAIETKSPEFTGTNYGTIVYMKTGLCFYYLRAYLGDEVYDKIMQKYFDTWKFKHPYPEDLRALFEDETKQNLSWLFDDLIKTDKKIDFKVSHIQRDTCGQEGKLCYNLKIKNKGDVFSPYSISSYRNDSLISKTWYAWSDPKKQKMDVCVFASDIDRIELNAGRQVPEINLKNNMLKIKGLFRKHEGIKVQPLFSIERHNKSQIMFTPVASWNNYDKWSLGLLLNNSFLPSRSFEYQLMPTYSFSAKRWNGLFHSVKAFYFQSPLVHHLDIGVLASSFSFWQNASNTNYYERISPYIQVNFKKSSPRSSISNTLRVQSYLVNEYIDDYHLNNTYHRAIYTHTNKNVLSPTSVKAEVEYKPSQFLRDYVKGSITANKKWRYNQKGSHISARIFAGAFFYNNTNDARYNFRMDGIYGTTTSGAMLDYTYDHLYLGRSETSGILSQQFSSGGGDFKIRTPLGQSNEWITSANIKLDLPFSKNIGLFADFGYSSNNAFLMDGGAYLSLFKGIVDIYIPFAFSQNIKDVPAFTEQKFAERIRFNLHLESLNPFKMAKSAFN